MIVAVRLYTARAVRAVGTGPHLYKGLVTWKWVMVQPSGIETPFGPCIDCEGHYTEAEARAHWREHVANRLTAYRQSRQYAELPCQRCLRYTKLYALVGLYDTLFDLCERCQTPAAVEQLIGTPADLTVEVGA